MNSPDVDTYFRSFDALKHLQRSGAFDRAYALAMSVLPGLKTIMREDLERFGRRCIDSSPPLEYALRHLTFVSSDEQAHTALAGLRAFLSEPASLAEWLPWVDEAAERRALWQSALKQVRAEPGSIQAKLKHRVKADGRTIAALIYDADKRGLVRRVRDGASYRLYAAV